MKKKVLALVLCLAMILSVLPISVFAEENIAEGEGWFIDEYACLHILEDIEIPDENETWVINENEDLTPWAEWKDEIRSVVIEDDVLNTIGAYLFSDCEMLRSATISYKFFRNNDVSYMFRNCINLRDIDFGVDVSANVSKMNGMFAGCTRLRKVNLSVLHYYEDDEEDKIYGLFDGCDSLTEICIDEKLLPLIAEQLINSYGTWYAKLGGAPYETAEELSKLDGTVTLVCKESAIIPNIVEGSGWYLDGAYCLHLTGAVNNPSTTAEDLTPWKDVKRRIKSVDTELYASVDNCAHLFDGCTQLSSLNLRHLSCSKVTNTAYMFKGCSSLTSIELVSPLRDLTDMSGMFMNCKGLRTLTINNLRLSDSAVTSRMFDGCSLIECKINGIALAKIARELYNMSETWTDKKSGTVYSDVDSLMNAGGSSFDLFSGSISVFGIGWHIDTDDCLHFTGSVSCPVDADRDRTPWKPYKDEIRSVIAHEGSSVTTCFRLLSDCSVLTYADVRKLNVSKVIDFSLMFANCPQLEYIDIIGLHTDSAKYMHGMFEGCSRLQEVDVAYLETEYVTDMSDMFCDCSSLRSLDFNILDVDSLETASGMFEGCTSLSQIRVYGPLSLLANEVIDLGGFWCDEAQGVIYDTAEKLNSITDDITLVKRFLAFDSISLVLSGELGLNFYTVVNDAEAVKDGYMLFEIGNSGETQRVNFSDAVLCDDGRYVFRCNVNALQMADTITVSFHNGDTVIGPYTKSVAQYLNNIKTKYSDNAELVALTEAIADYGHFAQPALQAVHGFTLGEDGKYQTMNRISTGDFVLPNAADLASYAATKEGNIASVTKLSKALALDHGTDILLYLTCTDGYTPSITVTDKDGNSVACTLSPNASGKYTLTIPQISAHKLGDFYTVCIDNGAMEIEISALSYAYSILSSASASAAQKEAVAALYYYYQAAIAYQAAN